MNSIVRNRARSITGAATTITDFQSHRKLCSDSQTPNGKITTLTGLSLVELGYVDGTTSNIRTQLDTEKSLHLSLVQRLVLPVEIKHGRPSILLPSQNLPISTSRMLVSPLLSLVQYRIHSQEIYEQTLLWFLQCRMKNRCFIYHYFD